MTTPIYTTQTWVNGEAGNTPLSDTRLDHMEAGIHDASLTANAAAALIPPAGIDLVGLVNAFVAPFSSVQGYREPTGPELTNALAGLAKMLTSTAEAGTLLTPLGFTVSTGVDSVSKRPYALAYSPPPTDQRGWGLYLFDLSAPIDLVIEAPHPIADQYSEIMAVQHWQKRPGSLLMVAGAHRDAASALADVAHQTNNVFHGMAAAYATKKIAQVQWHGYADATAAGLTHVISAATGNIGAAVKRVSTQLAEAGFTVGNAWDSSGSGTTLTAVTNVQGIDAAAKLASFVHVEANATTRGDLAARAKTVQAVWSAEVEALANADGGLPAVAGVGFPQTIGTANTVGTAVRYAREDHIHKERQATLDRITALESYRAVLPFDWNYVAWSSDPNSAVATAAPTAGLVYVQKVPVRLAGQLLSNLHCGVTATGTMTSGQNFMAVFDASTGTRLGITADITAALAATGEVKAAITTPFTIATPVFVYLALLLNGSPMITFARSGGTVGGIGNANLAAAAKRSASYGSGQTAMPSSLTLASLANTANAPWLAVS